MPQIAADKPPQARLRVDMNFLPQSADASADYFTYCASQTRQDIDSTE
jgi:hypothetical protein